MLEKIKNNKSVIYLILFLFLIGITIFIILFPKQKEESSRTSELEALVLSLDNKLLTVQDNNNVIYTFNFDDDVSLGSNILLEYTGILDESKDIQEVSIVSYKSVAATNDNGIPITWQDNGIFSDYYKLAYNKLKKLSLEDKIGQLLLVRYPDSNQKEILKENGFGGYVFFERDFAGKNESEVKNMMRGLQDVADIPILTAVDEEGGRVVRLSSNSLLRSEKFKSSSDLYSEGGFDLIKNDTIEKSKFLKNLGLNLNLAPVVDVSTDPNDYMYPRSLGKNTELTSTYAKTVIEASKGTGVSYTLKHFPGYGNNSDTHSGGSVDTRTIEDIRDNDLPPFASGIEAGAEAVLVSHNTVNSIDSSNPASLSTSVHNLLRNDLGFTGIIITDDLAMGATSSISNKAVKALLAGNDMIITTDYAESINEITSAVNNGTLSEDVIDKLAFKVLAWKYYKGLMLEQK